MKCENEGNKFCSGFKAKLDPGELSDLDALHILVCGMDGHRGLGVPLPVWDLVRHLIVRECPCLTLNAFASLVKKAYLTPNDSQPYYSVDDIGAALELLEAKSGHNAL